MLIFQEAAVTNAGSSSASGTPHGPWVSILPDDYCLLLLPRWERALDRWTLSDVIVERDLVHTCASFVPTPRLMPLPMPIGDTSARHLSSADHLSPAAPNHRCRHRILLVYCYKHVAETAAVDTRYSSNTIPRLHTHTHTHAAPAHVRARTLH